MNVEEKADMCRFIFDIRDEFGITCVLIEHDMGVVMDISDRLVVLDWGDSFQAIGAIQNQGDAAIPDASQVAVYASPKASISRGSVR